MERHYPSRSPLSSLRSIFYVESRPITERRLSGAGMGELDIETLLNYVWDIGLGELENTEITKKAKKDTIRWYETQFGVHEEGFLGGPDALTYQEGIEALVASLGPGKIVGIAGRPASGKSYLARRVAGLAEGTTILDEENGGGVDWEKARLLAEGSEGVIVPGPYLDHDAPLTTRVFLETSHSTIIMNAFSRMHQAQTPGLFRPSFQNYLFYECDFQKGVSDLVIKY